MTHDSKSIFWITLYIIDQSYPARNSFNCNVYHIDKIFSQRRGGPRHKAPYFHSPDLIYR